MILNALYLWYGEGLLASHEVSDHRYELRTNESPGSLAESDLLLSPHQKVSRRPTCNEEMVISLLGLLAICGSWALGGSNQVVCLVYSGVEVFFFGKKELEINYVLVKKSTSDDWSMLVSKFLKDCLVDGVSDKLFQFFTLVLRELVKIDVLWKFELSWLLCIILVIVHLLLSTTWSHLSLYWLAALAHSTHVLSLTDLL